MIKRQTECGLHFDLRLFDSAGNPVQILREPIEVMPIDKGFAAAQIKIRIPLTVDQKDENK